MSSNPQQRLLEEIKYLKSKYLSNYLIKPFLFKKQRDYKFVLSVGLIEKQQSSTSKTAPPIRKAPKGPSRTWRNPVLTAPPPPPHIAPVPPPPVPVASKILVNPNFKGNKILVNPNFEPPKKILVNPAFQQPKTIHVNPKMLSKPSSPKVATPKSPRVLFKSKNKLILKKQQSTPGRKIVKVSPLIFKSKNKLVRRNTVKKTPVKQIIRQMDKRKVKQGLVGIVLLLFINFKLQVFFEFYAIRKGIEKMKFLYAYFAFLYFR